MAGPIQLSKMIRAIPKIGKYACGDAPDAVQMDASTAKDFMKRIASAFDTVSKTRTGTLLIDAIDETGHECVIYAGGDNQKEAAVAVLQEPRNFKHMHDMFHESFRPSINNMLPMNQRGDPRAEDWFKKKYDELWGKAHAEIRNETASVEFMAVLNRAKAKYNDPLAHFSAISRLSYDRLIAMVCGAEPFPDQFYYPLCYEFYDFLTPRAGAPTQIRCSHKIKAHSMAGDKKQKDKNWLQKKFTKHSGNDYKKYSDGASAPVVLAHEMIHAWRMMAGKRVVHSGWGEEAMTVGIEFASDWPLTENQIRADLGFPRRNDYNGVAPTNNFDFLCKSAGYDHVWDRIEAMT